MPKEPSELPEADHVGRYCKPTTIENNKAQATAFMLRDQDEGLSVNWLEYLAKDRESQLVSLRISYLNTLDRVATNARIAVLNVGHTIQRVAAESGDNRKITIKHTYRDKNPSHAEVFDMRPDDELIAEIIAQCVIEDLQPAKE
jgi:hypothetical protein